MKYLPTFMACLLVCLSLNLAAQEKEEPLFNGYHKNIYVGLFGSNLFAGANYDMRLQKGRMDGIGFRAGIGGVNISATDEFNNQVRLGVVTFPLEVNYVVGKRRSGFVAGVGVLPMYVNFEGNGTLPDYEYFDVEVKGPGIAGFLDIGYRLQPLNTGLMLQVNWNPLFSRDGFGPGWVGFGIGMGFK